VKRGAALFLLPNSAREGSTIGNKIAMTSLFKGTSILISSIPTSDHLLNLF
jgi:hypothetical protein